MILQAARQSSSKSFNDRKPYKKSPQRLHFLSGSLSDKNFTHWLLRQKMENKDYLTFKN